MDLGRMFGDRCMMNRQVVDEHGRPRPIAFDDGPGRYALPAAIADDFVTDAVAG